MKVLTLVFVSITGLVVLGGHTSVPDPHANFVNPFEGTATTYGLTNALYKVIFSYAGFENAFNVVNEVKVSRFKLLKTTSRASDNLTMAATESRQADQTERFYCSWDRDCAVHLGEHCLFRCWFATLHILSRVMKEQDY